MKLNPIAGTDSGDITQADRILEALWTEVLQLTTPPRAADNFFSLGGDSMAAVILEYRIGEELHVHLSPGTLFGAPTFHELSQVVNLLIGQADAVQDSSPSSPDIVSEVR